MKKMTMKKYVVTVCQEVKYMIVCAALLLAFFTTVNAAEKEAPEKIIRVGALGDTFNYVTEKGMRKGYSYELLETLAGYTGWKFEYVACNWTDCFEKLQNGEIDILGDIAYTEERTDRMLFSDVPMGVEKYYLYADFSSDDISSTDFKTLNGKRIGVLIGAKPEVMLKEWELKNKLKTIHVNIESKEDALAKLENGEIDCFVSLDGSFWADKNVSIITRIGKSNIYFAINKDHPEIKKDLELAMRQLEEDRPFYLSDLYKQYFSSDYTPVLSSEEKSWLKEHGAIRMGFLANDVGASVIDPSSGTVTGAIAEEKKQTINKTKHLLYPYVYVDVSHVSEIFINIISNAIKYTNNGGVINCDISQVPGKKNGWCDVIITVKDNGIGMSDQFLKHIYEPFERERNSTISRVEGSGIGMGIVKKLVELMDGSVDVQSKIGDGSTFTVTIPCKIASKEESVAKRDKGTHDKANLVGARILVVEDNYINAEIATELLEEEGCIIERACNGVECIDMLEKADNSYYAMILMDIQMPVMNGYDATRKIRRMKNQNKAQIPIIAMTANAFTEDRQMALDVGMNDHVSKPIDMNILVPIMMRYV